MNKIKGFPIEIIELMLYYQEQQGNERNIDVFKNIGPDANKVSGGFDWKNTPEGTGFWSSIFNKKDFNSFFIKYPHIKRSGKTVEDIPVIKEELSVGTKVVVNKDGKIMIRRLLSYDENFVNPVIVITEAAYQSLIEGDTSRRIEVRAYPEYTLYKEENIVELTLTDISNGKGLGIPPHLIKIIK